MSKGTLPVPHIIAIVLGIIVLALLGYWFFTTGGTFSGTASEAECRGKFLQYCISWSAVNFKGDERPGGEFFTTKKDCGPHKSKLAPQGDETACRQLLGISGGGKPSSASPVNSPTKSTTSEQTAGEEDITVDAIREVRG